MVSERRCSTSRKSSNFVPRRKRLLPSYKKKERAKARSVFQQCCARSPSASCSRSQVSHSSISSGVGSGLPVDHSGDYLLHHVRRNIAVVVLRKTVRHRVQ